MAAGLPRTERQVLNAEVWAASVEFDGWRVGFLSTEKGKLFGVFAKGGRVPGKNV